MPQAVTVFKFVTIRGGRLHKMVMQAPGPQEARGSSVPRQPRLGNCHAGPSCRGGEDHDSNSNSDDDDASVACET